MSKLLKIIHEINEGQSEEIIINPLEISHIQDTGLAYDEDFLGDKKVIKMNTGDEFYITQETFESLQQTLSSLGLI